MIENLKYGIYKNFLKCFHFKRDTKTRYIVRLSYDIFLHQWDKSDDDAQS